MSRSKKKKKIDKANFSKPVTRLKLPSNKRHKTKKDYVRIKKIRVQDVDL